MGGEELDAFLWCFCSVQLETRRNRSAFLVRGFPLTPPAPYSPQIRV